jgi:hypothetical protein
MPEVHRKRGRPTFIWKAVFYPKYNKEIMKYEAEPFIEFGDPEKLAKKLANRKRSLWFGDSKIVFSRCEGTEDDEIRKLELEFTSECK